jgi:hypothetical protein
VANSLKSAKKGVRKASPTGLLSRFTKVELLFCLQAKLSAFYILGLSFPKIISAADMAAALNKYIKIKKLSNLERSFKRLENEFIEIMYPDHFSNNSLVMILDVGLDGNKTEDIEWLKQLLDQVLVEIGESNYFLEPYVRKS